MRRLLSFTALLSLVWSACGGAMTPAPSVSSPPPPAAKPAQQVSLADVGLDASKLDRTADPCHDFYRYACGAWLDRTEIPKDKAQFGTFNAIYDRNELILREILEQAAQDPGSDPVLQKLGAFYGSCMDEPAIEKAGTSALAPLFAITSKVKDSRSLIDAIGQLHARGIRALFALNPTQDKKDATQMIAQIGQSGLGLPDRDYYVDDDPDKRALRDAYLAHIENLFTLNGKPKASAKQAAANTMAIEIALAKTQKTRVELRDETGTYNRIDREGLVKLAPLPWDLYFERLGQPEIRPINTVSVPYVEGFARLARSFSPAQLRDYLDAQILITTAPALPKRFADEAFELTKKLTGQKEQRPRWKRCISYVDKNLGELLAQPFIARAFAGESKQAALSLTQGITQAFAKNLDNVAWMDPATRDKARSKLSNMLSLIGYPDRFRSYDYAVTPDQFTATTIAAASFDVQYQLGRIGKPVDRREWQMTPPTVNAYYDPQLNEMCFPAGILQPPFYDVKSSVPVNFGAIGMVVGHELTHGFDDQGAQYDGGGKLSGWWPENVTTGFKSRTKCVADFYARYEPLPGIHLNGQLTLGENIADMGGVKLAFAAYRAAKGGADTQRVADGFSEDQQFFLALGQAWCTKVSPELERMKITVDPHSTPRFRVTGSLSNLPEFAEAWQCHAGAPMRPAQTCTVW
ncbi:MAG TPA: M13 family metallopeptidase [Polyangiales bacterium]|nr:M13 family metallopeptidase [Polyangiales bacterium]